MIEMKLPQIRTIFFMKVLFSRFPCVSAIASFCGLNHLFFLTHNTRIHHYVVVSHNNQIVNSYINNDWVGNK